MKNFYSKLNVYSIILFFSLLTAVIQRYNHLTFYFIYLNFAVGLMNFKIFDLNKKISKIFYLLIALIFVDLLIDGKFYLVINIIIFSLSTLIFLKKIEIEKIISIIKYIYYIFIIILIWHLLVNIYNNGYIINPIQYRDYGIIIAICYSVINIQKCSLILSNLVHTTTLFLAFITNSRFIIYIVIFTYLYKNTTKSYLLIIHITMAFLLYFLLTNSADFGSLIMRLKYGFDSPTRFNNDWVSGYKTLESSIINNQNIIENINPHNFFLDSSIKNGLFITIFILLLMIYQFYKIIIYNYKYLDIKKTILNLNIVILIYGLVENSNIYLYIIISSINYFYIYKINNLNKNL